LMPAAAAEMLRNASRSRSSARRPCSHVVSTGPTSSRSAATVHCSFGRTENGANW